MLEQSSSEIPSSLWASMNSWFTPAVFFVLLNLMIGTIALTSALAKKNPNQKTAGSGSGSAVLQRLKSSNFYPYFNRSQDPHNSHIYKQAPDSAADTQASYFFQENCVQVPHDSSVGERTPDSDTLFVSGEKGSILGGFEGAHRGAKGEQERSPEKTRPRFVSGEKDSTLGDFEGASHGGDGEESEPGQSMEEVFSRLSGGHGRTKSDTVPASGVAPAKLPAKMKKSASLKSAFGHFEEEKIVEARRPATVREARTTDGDVEVDAKADDFISRFKQQLRIQRLDSIIKYKDHVIGRVSGGR